MRDYTLDPTRYEVTPDGRVFSLISGVPRELKQRVDAFGYARVLLHIRPGRALETPVHRLMLWNLLGPPPTHKHVAAHNDGSRRNHIDNLRWATPSENLADAFLHGKAKGTPLTPEQRKTKAAAKARKRYKRLSQSPAWRAQRRARRRHRRATFTPEQRKRRLAQQRAAMKRCYVAKPRTQRSPNQLELF